MDETAKFGGSLQSTQSLQDSLTCFNKTNRYGWRWRLVDNTLQAVKFTFDSVSIINTPKNENQANILLPKVFEVRKNTCLRTKEPEQLCQADNLIMRPSEGPRDRQRQDSENRLCHRCEDTINIPRDREESSEMQQKIERNDAAGSSGGITLNSNNNTESLSSMKSIGSFVCRICHNAEHPERLISPCLCKGSLTYVHTYCLEHWISTSGKTKCELCQFQYKTSQTLRYTCLQSLRMWYSNSMSRRALQEDCQMFSLLTLVAFGIIGTILVGMQHYFVQEKSTNMPAVARVWTKGWLLFFLFATCSVYFMNVYILVRGQLAPWYRWWQSAREIKLILENRKTFHPLRILQKSESAAAAAAAVSAAESTVPAGDMSTNLQDATHRTTRIAEEDEEAEEEQEVAIGSIYLTENYTVGGDNRDVEAGGRRHALVPSSHSGSDNTLTMEINNQQQELPEQQAQQQQQPQNEQPEGQQQDNRDQVVASSIRI